MRFLRAFWPALLPPTLAVAIATGYAAVQSSLPYESTVRIVSSLPSSGFFPGQMVVLVGDNTDPLLHMWNQNDNAWEEVSGDAADPLFNSVTIGGSPGTFAASEVVSLDANSEYGGAGYIRSVDTLVSSAQVLALNAAPITVVPAPAAGEFIQFVHAVVFLDFNTAAYVDDAGEDLIFQYVTGNTRVSQSIDGSEFDGTADAAIHVGRMETINGSTTNTMADGDGIEVTVQAGEWITGDSPLKIRVFYRLVRLASLEAIS